MNSTIKFLNMKDNFSNYEKITSIIDLFEKFLINKKQHYKHHKQKN